MTVTHRIDVEYALVDTATRLRDTLYTRDTMNTCRIVFEPYFESFTDLLALLFNMSDIASFLELLGNCHFERRKRHRNKRLADSSRVRETYDEIADRVVYHRIYQEDFLTPGIFPSSASSRKQIRQRLKSRIKPRGRPHLKQRRTVRELNFGVRLAFAMSDFLAINMGKMLKERCGEPASRLAA